MRGSLATLLALSTLSTACGDDSPFASFETRCGKLPPTHLKVVAVPFTFERDDSQSIETLTAKRGSALATHRANGLTAAAFGYSADIELNAVDDRRGSWTCGMPRLRVELSMQPVTVFVASELATGSCQHDVTLLHEMKHVEVMEDPSPRNTPDVLLTRRGQRALTNDGNGAKSASSGSGREQPVINRCLNRFYPPA